MRRIAEPKEIKIKFVCNGQNFLITGDYSRLRQMIIIVIDNAMKFSPNGKNVDIVLSETKSGVDVTIRDEGCGIHPDTLPFIFERFYKHRSDENKTGTGLGLAIAKQIAERHGISVGVTSVIGQGTVFSFRFHRNIDG
jgi:signal transduction histidine kinase